ncbi:MAG: NAD(P)H-binding protein [Sneathiellales bacterium]|nr:NAD(P)H-binding protein [Sneathiellales bacterium]
MHGNILITGATGMIGSLVLEHCLAAPVVTHVTSLVRTPSGISHPKLRELLITDFMDLGALKTKLAETDLVFYCLGAYTGQVSKEEMRHITVDMPVHLADILMQAGTRPRFCLLSGAGADRTGKSRMAFARDKGAVETYLSNADIGDFYAFRPAYIYPETPRKEPNFSYRLMRLAWPLIRLLGDEMSIRSGDLARAMVQVGLKGHSSEILENRDILSCLYE